MPESELSETFEANRSRLRSVAYRMLGSLGEADDAVQEAWMRLQRADAESVENLPGWLTTVVARVCLDQLRKRQARREEALEEQTVEPAAPRRRGGDPEQEALMAEAVGVALLVVLDRLAPPERLAFVMHDMFAVPFEEIAPVVGRSVEAARQLASRARRRVQGAGTAATADLRRQRGVVEAFLTALRAGDFEGLLKVLDPEVVVRVDAAAAAGGVAREVHGARAWAQGAIAYARAVRSAQLVLLDGQVGVAMAAGGRMTRALRFTLQGDKIVLAEVIAEPARLQALAVEALPALD